MNRKGPDGGRNSQAEFSRHLKSGQISPLYLFEGEETYLRGQALTQLIEAAVESSVRDFNVSPVPMTNGDLGSALDVARQLPMISSRRVVIVTGFEAINDEKQLESLKDYLRHPSNSTSLVFTTPALDNRRTIATILRKGCFVVSFRPLEDRQEAPVWIADYINRSAASIELSDASYLVGTVGSDLGRLVNEADKLITFRGDRGRITRAEIDALVVYSREHSNFDLTDAIVDGDRRRALAMIDHMVGNTPQSSIQGLAVMILGAAASTYRRLLAAQELIRQGASQDEVAKAAGKPRAKVGEFNERARRLGNDRIVSGLESIAKADLALKTSLATPRLLLELLICELCPAEPLCAKHG